MRRALLLLGLALLPGWIGAHMAPHEPVANAPNTLELEVGEREVNVRLVVAPEDQGVFAGDSGLRVLVNRSEKLEFEMGEWREQAKVLRDELTGRALAGEAGRGEMALVAEWRARLASKPEILEVHPPMGDDGKPQAKIGFVVRHRGLAVNDHALLDGPRELQLDWGDPWRTKFRDPRLRRAFGEEVELFVVRERAGLRVEVAARPVLLLPDLAGVERIAAKERSSVLEQVTDVLGQSLKVSIDGRRVPPSRSSLRFVRRSLGGAEVIPESEAVEMLPAVIGAVMQFGGEQAVNSVTIECDLFAGRVQRIPLSFRDGTAVRRVTLAPDRPDFRWQRGEHETVPADPPPEGGVFVGWIPRLPWAVVAVVPGLIWGLSARRRKFWVRWLPLPGLFVVSGFASGWGAWEFEVPDPRVEVEEFSEAEANVIAERVLRGVFGSFNEGSDESRRRELTQWTSKGRQVEEQWLPIFDRESEFGTQARFRRFRLEGRSFSEPPTSRGIRFDCELHLTLGNEHWGHAHIGHERIPVTVEMRPTWLGWRLERLSPR